MAASTSRPVGTVLHNVNKATKEVATSFSRLSSGLRINSAADDPAGIGLASALQLERRVLSQAVRNISEGISLLSIAQSAAEAMTSVVDHLKELADQASSSSATYEQRVALDLEADSLVEEYNRIVNSTTYNKANILSDTSAQITFQLGDVGSSMTTTPGLDTSVGVGDGTTATRSALATGTNIWNANLADINEDGKLDLISPDWNSSGISIQLGNGDGTFRARTSLASVTYTADIDVADVNGDGHLDLVAARWFSNAAAVYFGNGDGSFGAARTYAIDLYTQDILAVDVNGDGALDLVTADAGTSGMSVLLNNGDGYFAARNFLSVGTPGLGLGEINYGDFNNDDVQDLIAFDPNAHRYSIFIGNGDGSFLARISYAASSTAATVAVADVNNDHTLDLVVGESLSGGTKIEILLGNGDGTFSVSNTLTLGGTSSYTSVTDINGDGELDIVTPLSGLNQMAIILGNGDGTFRQQTTYTTGATPRNLAIGELNGDGALDIVVTDSYASTYSIFFANARRIGTIAKLDLVTIGSASTARSYLETIGDNLTQGRGKIFASLSRAGFAFTDLQSHGDSISAAYSRVTDVDVAAEVAALTAAQIRQQSGLAIEAHAQSLATNAYSLLLD